MEVNNLKELKSKISNNFPDVEISENELGNKAFVVILRGGLNASNPKAYMDAAVSEYVQHLMFNEFVEIFMDNPWVRVIIFNFNDIDNWRKFDQQG